MSLEFLSPVSEIVAAHVALLPDQALGKEIKIHTSEYGVPELDKVNIAIIGVRENRNDINFLGEDLYFDTIRKSLYDLFPGNWDTSIVDLGDIIPGEEVSDTYFLMKDVLSMLLQKNVTPLIIGGSQDLVYGQYRAFDILERMVNLVNVDSRFDLGNTSQPIKNNSFVGKIIVEQPYNLFNYSNIGYQTYFNSQEEIDLIEKLYFDAYRLGEVTHDVTIVEPIMRDADIVAIDLGAMSSTCLDYKYASPNGFNGREICAIARYAGISDKVKSFGVYEFKNFKHEETTALLIAQILWYFIEGVNYRSNELDIKNQAGTLHYNVPIEDEVLSFYKSPKTERWWIEIPFISSGNNKLKRHTLLPCTYNDYERACNQEIPERWYKAKRKNEV
ncbi:formimidoylglutamase [Aquimarina sp. MMG015]|uniref:formimidoylglutamase n=1 Tax=Aquimarina TaxID=290174 RepID=UPI0004019061|nr:MULTISPECIES: formimidoylglutamase [Aquimarina]AXT56807.1 arginase [Aquimarina sp. AD1]MBQ4802807.1 formimidoylglutamase [Aquimarina sp. MMG015]RKN31944.1 arginase [Aquimarina sp. AD1]